MPALSLFLCALLLLSVTTDGTAPRDTYPDAAHLAVITELPDPFLLPDGKRVQTKRQWEAHRKTLLALALHYEYGPLPPKTTSVAGKETVSHVVGWAGSAEAGSVENGTGQAAASAIEKNILLTMGPKHAVQTHLVLTVPAGQGPFPVIVCGDLTWGRVKPEIVRDVVARGYALAEFDRTEIAPDSAQRGGVYAAYSDYNGGRMAAWAWGYSLIADYLLTLPFVDRSRLVITGHSRGGKATLLAGALDTRFALVAPNASGCGGAGGYRVQAQGSEDIGAILKNFSFWFAPDFGQFVGHTDRLPFDQHTLKALVAPRALLTTEATGDLWANPAGTQQTYMAAREVYDFLGVPERIGIHYRPGGHEHNAEDWNALLDFADQQFFHKTTARKFDRQAFPGLPHAFSWQRPNS